MTRAAVAATLAGVALGAGVAVGGCHKSHPPAPAASSSAPAASSSAPAATLAPTPVPDIVLPAGSPLTRAAVQATMARVRPALKSCYVQHRLRGVGILQLMVAPTGDVGAATVDGTFADTPTGNCLAAAARGARFPHFSGTQLEIDYRVMLP